MLPGTANTLFTLLFMRYRAHAVDLYGVSLAEYQFECRSDEEAEHRATVYLRMHPTIDLWQGARRIVRLARDEA